MQMIVFSRGYPTPERPMNGIFEYDQAKALAAMGNKVILAVLDLRSLRHEKRIGRKSFVQDGVYVEVIRCPVGRVPLFLKQSIMKYVSVTLYRDITHKFGHPQIIHSHFLQIGHAVVLGLGNYGIPIVHSEHSSLLNKDIIHPNLKRLGQITYPLCNQVLAVSTSFAGVLHRHFGVDARVVPNIVDTALFSPSGKTKPERPFRVISVGSLNPNKRMDLLIRSYARAFKNEQDHELIIIGRGSEEKKLLALIRTLDIAEHVKIAGQLTREQIRDEMAKSHCFCLLSETETFGVAYAEALAAGLPVIATPCGGPEDFLSDQTGILLKQDGKENVAEALRRMKDNWQNYDPCKLSAIVRETLSPAVVSEALLDIYQEVIDKERNLRCNS